jgi:hypothetical protein
MQRTIVHAKYYDLSVVKAFFVGIGYHDEELVVAIGPLIVSIKVYMFKKRKK